MNANGLFWQLISLWPPLAKGVRFTASTQAADVMLALPLLRDYLADLP